MIIIKGIICNLNLEVLYGKKVVYDFNVSSLGMIATGVWQSDRNRRRNAGL